MKLLEFAKKINLSKEALQNIQNNMPEQEEYLEIKRLFWEEREEFYRKVKKSDQWEIMFLVYFCCFACDTYKIYQQKKIEEKIFWDTFLDIRYWCENCYREYGIHGIHQYDWFFRLFDLTLFRLGRLEFEKMEGDVIYIHIPQGEPLRWEECEKSIQRAYQQWGREKQYRCHSWLLFPMLKELLPADSNILVFQKKFDVIELDYKEKEAEWRIFGKVLETIEEYQEDTSLRRAAKKYLQTGKKLGNGLGILRYCQ